MKKIELLRKIETEINKTPTGELRNLLCDINIVLQTLSKTDKILLDAERYNIPIFTFIAKDSKALKQIINYRDDCAADCSVEHYRGIENTIDAWVEWQNNNPEKIKLPD